MIDDTVILFSTGMCLFILLRAIRLDSILPWFSTKKSARFDGWQEPPPPPRGGPRDVP
jgi:hypothetical protein